MSNQAQNDSPETEAPSAQLQVLQLINGMWASQIVSAVAALSLADQIDAGKTSVADLASSTAASEDGIRRLLNGAMTIGLVELDAQGQFRLTALGECLRSDTPGSLRSFAIAETAQGHWAPWGLLAEAVRTGRPVAEKALGLPPWEYYARNREEGLHFAGAMSNLSAAAGAEVTANYDVSRFKKIVDVGGSQGVLLRAMLAASEQASGILFDLPEVIEGARPVIERSPFAARIELVPGSFFETIPAGGDLYLLKHILHDWDEEHCATILKNIHAAAPAQSTLLVVEMLLPDTPGPSPVHLMDLNMLVMLGGRERTAGQYTKLLEGAGFRDVKIHKTGGFFDVVEARA